MKPHTWIFSGIGTLVISVIVTLIIAHKPSDVVRDASPTPSPAVSPLPTASATPVVEPTPTVDTKQRGEEERLEKRRIEIQRLEDQRREQLRDEEQRLEKRKAEAARAEEERLERRRIEEARAEEERLQRQRDEIRREEEQRRLEEQRREEERRREAAMTWRVARVRNRTRMTVNYSVLTDGEWRPYSVAPGATAGHERHGDVVIEFDRGNGQGTKRLILNSSTVRAEHPSKADTYSAPASYFGLLPDGSLGIFSH